MARVHPLSAGSDTNSNESQDDSEEEIHSGSGKKAIYVGEPNVYDVDHIVKKRKTNKKVQYLVKWKGYSSEDNSWQSAADISSDLIKEFENNKKKSSKKAATKRQSVVLQKSEEEICNGSINAPPIKKPKRTPKNATQQLHNKYDLTGPVNLNPFPELVATSTNISMEKEQMKKYEDQTDDEIQAPNETLDDAAVPTNFDQIMNEFFVQEYCNKTLLGTPGEVQLPNKLEAFEDASMTLVKESVTSHLEIPLEPLAVQKAVPIGASTPMQSPNKIQKKELHLERKMPMQEKLVQVESKKGPEKEEGGDLLGFDELMQAIFS